MIEKENLQKAIEICSTQKELAEYFNVSVSTIKRSLKKFNLSTFKRVFDVKKFEELYNNGLSDAEIARQLNCSNGTISNYRNKLNLPPNFIYTRDRIKNDILKLSETLSETKIAEMLNLDIRVVQYFKSESKINYDYIPTLDEQQIIIGCLLGDGNLTLNKSKNQANFRFAHSEKQKEYCIWKSEQLKKIMYHEHTFIPKFQTDTRTNKTYTSYYARSKEIQYFKTLFENWYDVSNSESTRNIKHIYEPDLMCLDALGLAIWFMDDGYKEDSGYVLATMCFSESDLQLIKKYFKQKWNIDVIIRKSKEIYIPSKFRDLFTKIIYPYVHSDCKYKLLLNKSL